MKTCSSSSYKERADSIVQDGSLAWAMQYVTNSSYRNLLWEFILSVQLWKIDCFVWFNKCLTLFWGEPGVLKDFAQVLLILIAERAHFQTPIVMVAIRGDLRNVVAMMEWIGGLRLSGGGNRSNCCNDEKRGWGGEGY